MTFLSFFYDLSMSLGSPVSSDLIWPMVINHIGLLFFYCLIYFCFFTFSMFFRPWNSLGDEVAYSRSFFLVSHIYFWRGILFFEGGGGWVRSFCHSSQMNIFYDFSCSHLSLVFNICVFVLTISVFVYVWLLKIKICVWLFHIYMILKKRLLQRRWRKVVNMF